MMKKLTPLRILIAFVAIFLLGRTLELFDDPVDPHFGLFQIFLGFVATVLFFTYIYLVVKERRKK